MSTMTVLYLTGTKNVLAAVTQTAGVTPGPTVPDLVAAGLRVRALNGADVTIDAARLSTVTVDVDPAVLADPRGFAVTPDGTPSVQSITSTDTVSITLSATAAVVSAAVTVEPLDVLLVIEKRAGAAPTPLVLAGKLSGGPTTFTVSLDKGDWQAVAFVADHHPIATQATVS
jgi:hypothetical protein